MDSQEVAQALSKKKGGEERVGDGGEGGRQREGEGGGEEEG